MEPTACTRFGRSPRYENPNTGIKHESTIFATSAAASHATAAERLDSDFARNATIIAMITSMNEPSVHELSIDKHASTNLVT